VDIELLSTFLEVKNTRHFGKAAENLYLTQAAVSARIKQLEKVLGTLLFIRYRNNLSLTVTGERLIPHAEAILIAWARTKQDISVGKVQKKVMTLGSTSGLSELCFNQGLSVIHQNMKELALRAEICDHTQLIKRILGRTIDLGFMYDPPKITELVSQSITVSELVLVSSQQKLTIDEAINKNYVAVDWGISYNMALANFFPDMNSPVLHTTLARTAFEFILSCGGCAYLPHQMIEEYLNDSIFLVKDAPVFQRPIYASYHMNNTHAEKITKIISLITDVISPQLASKTDEPIQI